MKTAKLGATIALLLFVGATVGMLIAQEVSQPKMEISENNGGLGLAAETVEVPPEPSPSESIPEGFSAGEPAASIDAETGPDPSPDATSGDAGASAGPIVTDTACVIDAIYFHNTNRCWTCRKIEQDAKTIVEAEFADELAAGTLRWSAINMEEERQYVDRYELIQPTLVLVRSVGDGSEEWAALDETWALVRDETTYATYIVEGFRAFMEGCP